MDFFSLDKIDFLDLNLLLLALSRDVIQRRNKFFISFK